jgi:hypothetical protein
MIARLWNALRARVGRHVPALVLFLAWAVVSLHPLTTQPFDLVPDNADALSCAWSVAWVCHAFAHEPWHLLRANMFYPDPAALMYQDPMIGPALLAWPGILLGASPALAYNLLLVLTLTACALGAYLLCLQLIPGRLPACVAGLAFAFTTANYDSVARVQILSSHWTPLVLYFLVRLVRSQRPRDGLFMGLAFALQTLSSSYYGLFLATLLLFVSPFVWLALERPRWSHVPWRGLALGALVSVALVGPLAWVQSRHLAALQGARNLRVGAQPGSSWLQTLPQNWLYGTALGAENVSYDDRYFPGLLPLSLLFVALVAGLSKRGVRSLPSAASDASAWLRMLAIFGAMAFVLACGSVVPLPWHGLVAGPYAWLHAHVSVFATTRVPSRFAMFARLALAIVAALGAARALAWLRRPWRMAAGALLCLLLPLEHLSTPLRTWRVPTAATLPAVDRWLKTQPRRGTLEFPPYPSYRKRSEAGWVWLSAYHWQPIVNGYASFNPPWHGLVIDEVLESFPSRGTLAMLRVLGVERIVVHPEPTGFPEPDAALQRFGEGLERFAEDFELEASFEDQDIYDGPLGRLGGERVYRLRPAPVTFAEAPADAVELPRTGWTCSSSQESPCTQAFDGNVETTWSTPRAQRGRDFVRVLLPRAVPLQGIGLRAGRVASDYPREPEIWVRSEGVWRLLMNARFDRAAFLRQLLAHEPTASLTAWFEPLEGDAVELRLKPTTTTIARWQLPELVLYTR